MRDAHRESLTAFYNAKGRPLWKSHQTASRKLVAGRALGRSAAASALDWSVVPLGRPALPEQGRSVRRTGGRKPWPTCHGQKHNQAAGQEADRCWSAIMGGPVGQALPF